MIAPLNIFSTQLAERMKEMFSPEGLLAKAQHYEYRPQQQQMAEAVGRCLDEHRHLIVEAGTGVGKSMAYLMPAIHYAVEKKRKALISTYTINLQEQLFHKDLPILQKLLPFNFQVALLKGRQNYICPRRLERALTGAKELFVSSEAAELERIREWFLKTEDGTLSDLDPQPDPKVWDQVCSEQHICTPRTCGNDPKCFYQQARKKILDANVVVLNHTLFFTLLGGMDEAMESEDGYLFPTDFVIFDEAHSLENVAARHIGFGFSSGALKYLLQKLYNPRTKKGLLHLWLAEGEKEVKDTLDELEQFTARVETACDFSKSNEVRIRKPELVEDTLSIHLMRLRNTLQDAASEKKDSSTQAEIRDYARRITDMQVGLADFLKQEKEEYVYWVERTGRQQSTYHLQAAPIDLSSVLRQLIYRETHSSIMTSATLSVSKNLNYFQSRIGGEIAETLQLDSPFDYPNQMKVFIPRHIPEPKNTQYEDALAHWIQYFVSQTHGKAFVLFTSYGVMQRIAQKLQLWFEEKNILLLLHGSDGSRHNLLKKFKEDTDSVLFGTDSFWQGVDVPGEALSNVIITRLPFAVPDHPLIEAKLEMIENQGGDPFREYSLPEAILRFCQGVGRLIRTQSDKGQVAILDSRILSKTYGKSFLAKLPQCPVTILEDKFL